MQMNMREWKDMLRVLALGRPLNMGSKHLVPELHAALTCWSKCSDCGLTKFRDARHMASLLLAISTLPEDACLRSGHVYRFYNGESLPSLLPAVMVLCCVVPSRFLT